MKYNYIDSNNVFIGDFTYGNPSIRSYESSSKLKIGKFCSISDGVTIFLGGEHRTDWITTYPFNALDTDYAYIKGHPKSKGNVDIGNDVWIAQGATIMSGVTIGDGAVIGCKAVVTKDIPPYAVVAGNPSKIIKYRFEQSMIEKLLKIKWWDMEIKKIQKYIPMLLSNDTDEFIKKVKEEL